MSLFEYAIIFLFGFVAVCGAGVLIGWCIYEGSCDD